MLKKKIYIIELKNLYKILDEIKEIFDFDLVYQKNLNFKDIELNNLIKNTVVLFICSKKFQLKLEKKITTQKIISLDIFPIFLKDLLEKISIFFLRFNYKIQSNIFIKNYILDLNSRLIKKNEIYLRLTEREVEMILFIFKNKGSVSIKYLQEKIWKQKKNLETHTVETHIYRLRKKFNKVFKDSHFISSNKKGYFI
jgi:hypothetical protein